jgi:hypothetical protein
MKIITLLFMMNICLGADNLFASLPDLVKHVNSLNADTIKMYSTEDDSISLVKMIGIAKFDPETRILHEKYMRFGMCSTENGVHILINVEKDTNGNYKIKLIGHCR